MAVRGGLARPVVIACCPCKGRPGATRAATETGSESAWAPTLLPCLKSLRLRR